jgi:hypothetical protein
MLFENYTPFPAIAWRNLDNKGKEHITVLVRVKYLFDTMDEEGLWSLKLDPEQGELFNEDVHYDEDENASVRFENDYVSYKPHADLVVNAYAHSHEEKPSWECGIKAVRHSPKAEGTQTLVEQWLKVYGERYWKEGLLGWKVGKAKPSKKVALRYENAFGGAVLDPRSIDKEEKEYLEYYEANPIGKGIIHKELSKQGHIALPQIESLNDPIVEAKKEYIPQGLGFVERSWEPRRSLSGTFDAKWIEEKHPVMPDDFQESFNNAATPNLQLKEKGYFHVGDSIVLHKLLKGKETQAFQVPGFYFKGAAHLAQEEAPFMLDADTLIVDILDDTMKNNAIYLSYRSRVPYIEEIDKVSLNMIVSEDFIEHSKEDEEHLETSEATHG